MPNWCNFKEERYHIDLKCLDREALENSADPDQTAP